MTLGELVSAGTAAPPEVRESRRRAAVRRFRRVARHQRDREAAELGHRDLGDGEGG